MMRRQFHSLAMFTPLLLIIAAAQDHTATAVTPPSSAARDKMLPPSDVSMIALTPRVSLAPLSSDEIARQKAKHRTAVGQNRNLSATSMRGQWMENAHGQWVWSVSVRAVGAAGLRLHFKTFDAGTGHVWVHDGAGEGGQILGP